MSLPEPPDAILAMNDTLAFAAMEVIRNHGLRIPQDIALIGYTDETTCQLCSSPGFRLSRIRLTRWGKLHVRC